MKFGKEFKKQMIPEWTDAYMDYDGLKRILRDILLFKQSKEPTVPSRGTQRRLALHSPLHGHNHIGNKGDVEDQAIDVNTIQREGTHSGKFYKTNFLHQSDEGGENEVMFFEKLDEELNKVNSFYKDKVDEVIDEAASLDKQMDALIALRFKVKCPDSDNSSPTGCHSTDIASTLPTSRAGDTPMTLEVETSHSYQHKELTNKRGKEHINSIPGTDTNHDSIQEIKNHDSIRELTNHDSIQETTNHDSIQEITNSPTAGPLHKFNGKSDGTEEVNENINDPLQILERVKINNMLETPMSTIKKVIKDSREDESGLGKDELRRVEDQLKLVFIEFYQKLRHLKSYSFINLSAFAKIMKKYEKIAARGASRSYMKIVDNSFIGNCDEVSGLFDRVEATFIKHFTKSNRREGMKSLRPKVKRDKHGTTFFSGFFSGCLIALVIAVVLNIEGRNLLDKEEGILYMENIFPLYSFYAYLVLHMLMYAGDIYFWRRYRVNYPFIFGFKQGTELGYTDVFLLGTGLGVLALGSFLTNLYMDLNSNNRKYKTFTKLVPLGLVMVVLAITFCPFNIVHRSSRFFLIRCIRRGFLAPLYKVTLPDFFLADNLTSQVQAIRTFILYICYYGMGEYSRKQTKCHNHDAYTAFYYIVAIIPYWIRFMQCLRRLIEEKDSDHAYNGLKYFLIIVAVMIRTAFELKNSTTWLVLALVSSAIAIIMSTYWDLVVDWGLLRRHSKNICLRDKLVISHKSVYFLAMILNIVLRFSWMQLVLEFNLYSMQKMAASIGVSCLEIIRRGIWNFFRLENEHLNNVGKYRAFKSVPLPFNYFEKEEEEEEKDD